MHSRTRQGDANSPSHIRQDPTILVPCWSAALGQSTWLPYCQSYCLSCAKMPESCWSKERKEKSSTGLEQGGRKRLSPPEHLQSRFPRLPQCRCKEDWFHELLRSSGKIWKVSSKPWVVLIKVRLIQVTLFVRKNIIRPLKKRHMKGNYRTRE